MTTVLSWGDSEGTRGRCDAKCHDASSPACECMCGGRFHGKALEPGGLELAIRELGEEVLEAARRRADAEGLLLQSDDLQGLLQASKQIDLFAAAPAPRRRCAG